ncbi:GNAT family N-acetyltransferase [Streptomyces bobili]|uniref:GNAT family N-acetyltransferase n=1 Tax=Streptomyces bobili TaxID=67280 RepID=UPI00343F74CC
MTSSSQLPATWAIEPVPYDTPAVQQLLREFQAAQTDVYGYADDPNDTPAADYDPPTGLFLLARDASRRPIGCGGWRRIDATTGEIKRMYVHPDARRHTLGRQLLHELQDHARQLGLTHMQLETGVANTAALALYRSQGYRPTAAYRLGRNPAVNRALRKAL